MRKDSAKKGGEKEIFSGVHGRGAGRGEGSRENFPLSLPLSRPSKKFGNGNFFPRLRPPIEMFVDDVAFSPSSSVLRRIFFRSDAAVKIYIGVAVVGSWRRWRLGLIEEKTEVLYYRIPFLITNIMSKINFPHPVYFSFHPRWLG